MIDQLQTPHSEPKCLTSGELCYFIGEVFIAFGQTLAHFVASEATYRNLLAGFSDLLGYQFANGLGRIFDKRLIEQHYFLVEFVQSPLDNFLNYLLRLVGILWVAQRLRARDFALLIDSVRGNIRARNVSRLGGGNVHGHVFYELLKLDWKGDFKKGMALYVEDKDEKGKKKGTKTTAKAADKPAEKPADKTTDSPKPTEPTKP